MKCGKWVYSSFLECKYLFCVSVFIWFQGILFVYRKKVMVGLYHLDAAVSQLLLGERKRVNRSICRKCHFYQCKVSYACVVTSEHKGEWETHVATLHWQNPDSNRCYINTQIFSCLCAFHKVSNMPIYFHYFVSLYSWLFSEMVLWYHVKELEVGWFVFMP